MKYKVSKKYTPGPWCADGLTVWASSENNPNFLLSKPDKIWLAQMITARPNEEDFHNADAIAGTSALIDSVLPLLPLIHEIDALGHNDESTCLHRIKAKDLRRIRDALIKAGVLVEDPE